MTAAGYRQAVADALSTVDGIKGFPQRPRAIKPGNAWPQWRGAQRADGQAYVQTWQIVVVLDQGTDSLADAAADRWAEPIEDALVPLLYIDSLAPATLPADGGDLYALLLTGRSE